MAASVFTAGGKTAQGKKVAQSAPAFNPQLLTDVLAGLSGFQQNPTINPMQRSVLDEQVAARDDINKAFGEIGKGARNALVQSFGTQMKNLTATNQVRGLAGSSLEAVGQMDLEGGKQQAIGDLEGELMNANADAIRELSNDYSGSLSGIADQNASMYGNLARLLMPEITADQLNSFSGGGGRNGITERAFSGGSGGGGGGGSYGGSSDGGSRIPYGMDAWIKNGSGGGGPFGTWSKNSTKANVSYSDSLGFGDWTQAADGSWSRPTVPKGGAKGGAAGGGGSKGSSGGGGGRGSAAPASGSAPGAAGGFSGFGGGAPMAPPPPPAGGEGEGDGEGEDEEPKYLFGWQKSGKSKFNPMKPAIKAGGGK